KAGASSPCCSFTIANPPVGARCASPALAGRVPEPGGLVPDSVPACRIMRAAQAAAGPAGGGGAGAPSPALAGGVPDPGGLVPDSVPACRIMRAAQAAAGRPAEGRSVAGL